MKSKLFSLFCVGFLLTQSLVVQSAEEPKMYLISPTKYNLEDLNGNANSSLQSQFTDRDVSNLSKTLYGVMTQVYANQDFISINPQIQKNLNRLKNIENYRKNGVLNRKEFMMDAMNIFNELSDLHTGLSYGFPYNCFMSGFPLKIKRILNPNSKKDHQKYVFVVSEKGNLDAILGAIQNNQFTDYDSASFYENLNLANIKKQFDEIQVGDVVTSIQGLAVQRNDEYDKLQDNSVSTFYTKDNDFLSDKQNPITQLSYFTRTHRVNTGATLARASDLIFSRYGGLMPIPGSGNLPVEFKLSVLKNGVTKSFTLPYFTTIAANPMMDTKGQCASFIQAPFATSGTPPQIFLKAQSYPSETFEDSVPVGGASSVNAEEASSISTKMIQYQGQPFAYIKIKSFLPSGEIDADYKKTRRLILESIFQIKQFVLDNSTQIHGIVFDVRDNPGGYGSYPMLLAKIFKGTDGNLTANDFHDFKIYPLNTEANQYIYRNLRNSEDVLLPNALPSDKTWVDSILQNVTAQLNYETDTPENRANFTQKFSVLDHNFDSDPNDSFDFIEGGIQNLKDHPESSNLYDSENLEKYAHLFDAGIVSPKTKKSFPLAVLVNGKTFSSGDIFTSAFKDYKIGKIYGQDTQTTGGGGANVIFYNSFQMGNDGPLNMVPAFDNNGNPIATQFAPVLPNDMFLSFGWNRVIRTSCFLSDNDCANPTKDENFIERYYKDDAGKSHVVSGVTVRETVESTLSDIIYADDVEKQPFVQKVLKDLANN